MSAATVVVLVLLGCSPSPEVKPSSADPTTAPTDTDTDTSDGAGMDSQTGTAESGTPRDSGVVETPTGHTASTGETGHQYGGTVFYDSGDGWITMATIDIGGSTTTAILQTDPYFSAGVLSATPITAPTGGGCTPSTWVWLSDLDGVDPLIGVAMYVETPGVWTEQLKAPFGYEEPPLVVMTGGVAGGLSGGRGQYVQLGPDLHRLEWEDPSYCDATPWVHADCTPMSSVVIEVTSFMYLNDSEEGVPGPLASSVPGMPLCVRG